MDKFKKVKLIKMKSLLKYLTIIIILFLISSVKIYPQGWFIQYTFSYGQTINAIKFYDENTGWMTSSLYNNSTYCIYKTTNAGQNWTGQNSLFTSMRFMSIWIVDPNNVYMSGNYGRIVKTTNGGQSWDSLITNTTEQLWGIQFVNPNTGYTAGSNGKIFKTTDAGVTWNQQNSTVSNAFSSVYFLNETTGFVSGSAIVVKTTNGGSSWTNMNAPFISGFENFRQIYFWDESTGIYGSDAGRILKSTNGGVNWYLVTSNTTLSIYSLTFPSSMTGYACGYTGVILKTNDKGETWNVQSSGVTDILTCISFTSVNTGYISTWYSKVLKTTNGGVTFINSISNNVPDKFLLEQNYPNPFNPTTIIRFQIKDSRFVTLKVFDITGKEITTLVNEKLSPGTYEVPFSINQFTNTQTSSGVYFYKLTSGSFTDTKKMLLVK
jgi:photosystem II stability/assembly factor-like uncharacterized protein